MIFSTSIRKKGHAERLQVELAVIYPRIEIADWPVLVEGLMSLCPPKPLRDVKIGGLFFARYEPLRSSSDHAAMGTLADGHPRHQCAVEHWLQHMHGIGGADPVFFAFHLFSSGKARSLNEADLNITQDAVQALLENSTKLVGEALTILRQAVWRHNAKKRVAQVLQMRACPADNLSGRAPHALDKVEQDRVGLRHRVFV
jgi:hypothetical protein